MAKGDKKMISAKQNETGIHYKKKWFRSDWSTELEWTLEQTIKQYSFSS